MKYRIDFFRSLDFFEENQEKRLKIRKKFLLEKSIRASAAGVTRRRIAKEIAKARIEDILKKKIKERKQNYV